MLIFVSSSCMQTKKLIYNFSSLGFIQFINFLLSLIVIPHVIRKVGANGFGIIAVAQVVTFYLSVLTDYGFNQTATREITLCKNDIQKISRIFFNVLAAKLLLCFIAFGLLIAIVFTVPVFHEHIDLYLLAFSFVIGQIMLPSWFFQGIEKMHYMAIMALIARAIMVVLVFIFIQAKGDESLFLFFMGLGNVVGGLIGIFFAMYSFKVVFIRPGWQGVINELKTGWQITLTNLSMSTCQYIGVFILRLFTNDFVVGYYSIAEKVYFAMKLMVGIFSLAMYPAVCQLVQEGKRSVMTYFRKHYLPFLWLVIAGCAIVFIFSPQIIFFFAGHSNDNSSFYLRMMCIAMVIVCLNMPAYLILLADDRKKNYLRIFVIGTILNIVANIILVKYFDATGTVFAVIITELFITVGLSWEVYQLYFYKKNDGKNSLKSFFYESK